MSALEVCAVILALIYVLLAIQQLRACWIAAIASAALYILIFWQVQLYLEAALQIFYIAMSVYGWAAWRPNEAQSVAAIRTWPLSLSRRSLFCRAAGQHGFGESHGQSD